MQSPHEQLPTSSLSNTLIYGRHPVIDAVRGGTIMDKIILQQGTRGEMEKEVRHLCRDFSIPMQVAPKERMNALVRGNHQGIIGMVSMIQYYRLEDVLPTLYEKEETPTILVLDGITDVRNFGAIARSAEVCGVGAIVIGQKNSAPTNAEAVKTSAGALLRIPVCREPSIHQAVDVLQQSGISVIASDLKAPKKLMEMDFSIPIAILMGSEGEGVHHALLQKANDTFMIPQKGTTDSFNVSVATGIILYEMMRQRILA